jgi:hypothetical protein
MAIAKPLIDYPVSYSNDDGSTITISTNGIGNSTISNSSVANLGLTRNPSSINGEDMFEFLKENIRVAEYVDDNNKLLYVELQMRAGPGFVWDKIRRVRLKETDDML